MEKRHNVRGVEKADRESGEERKKGKSERGRYDKRTDDEWKSEGLENEKDPVPKIALLDSSI